MKDLQIELQEQSALQGLKKEFEEVAKDINKYETQEVIRGKIEALEREMQDLE